jgi:ribonuclease HII
MKNHPLETALKKEGFSYIAGIDEAGRGPWAGPLVAAAVVLPFRTRIPGLNDSKKLTDRKRREIFAKIIKKADVGIGIVSNRHIDKFGLTKSLKVAYEKAILNLSRHPDCLLIDGIGTYSFDIPYKTVKKGDAKVRLIAAASIIAKVIRDTIMDFHAFKYPEYGFNMHKGYGTRKHHENLLKYGVCEIHRRSFKPVEICLKKSLK